MKKTSLLIGTALLFSAHAVTAAENYTCATPPTCASLGYDQSASDCAGRKMIKCPFDTSKVFCGGDCVSEGYQKEKETTTTLAAVLCLKGQTEERCPYDSTYYKCTGEAEIEIVGNCPTLGYTLTSPQICLIGQTKVTCSSDSTYFKCTDTGTVTLDLCASGFLSSDSRACDCEYGITPTGTKSISGKTCYRCGTYSECNVSGGGTACLKCNVDKLIQLTMGSRAKPENDYKKKAPRMTIYKDLSRALFICRLPAVRVAFCHTSPVSPLGMSDSELCPEGLKKHESLL